ncbi:microtubule-binding protein TANGLED-like [Quillaja saponaria]|uniref:Microtubule-binding protein TANGLED-like n=1 Tax=Quillaja saponaria TaxID=32244 RepID=A0AAD7Q1X5_QUISA|nr:microtubule-binding protein TANGLED-like [Quillaja saponaria]
MVARTPPKQKKMVAHLNPVLIRETVKKVDQCMARLQELQYTVAGGTKVISGVNLSPRSTRCYLRTSLRCKQESVRIRNSACGRSPGGKFPANTGGEWKRMSLPAMLVGETVGEILQASQFAREIVDAVAKKTTTEDPKTPVSSHGRNHKLHPENTQLKARRKKEKQEKVQTSRLESDSPSLQRARSRINFKISPPKARDFEKENNRYLANRVSPRNRPWCRKTVLFPNPLFQSTPSSKQQKFCKTRSPVIARNKQTPHKFLIKSPSSANSKFQMKIKGPTVVSLSPTRPSSLSKKSPKMSTASKLSRSFSPSKFQVKTKSPPGVSLSPTRPSSLSKKSPKISTASKLRRSFSPSKFQVKIKSPPGVSLSPTRPSSLSKKLRRSFSPSRLATRLVSPLKGQKGCTED